MAFAEILLKGCRENRRQPSLCAHSYIFSEAERSELYIGTGARPELARAPLCPRQCASPLARYFFPVSNDGELLRDLVAYVAVAVMPDDGGLNLRRQLAEACSQAFDSLGNQRCCLRNIRLGRRRVAPLSLSRHVLQRNVLRSLPCV